MKLAPPLKWHGGKHYLARRFIALMPPHIHYVEPFAGGLAVLLAKDPECVSEVINDLDGDLVNFWRVLQHPVRFESFRRQVEAVPCSRQIWEESIALKGVGDAIDRAVNFFIFVRQSHSARGELFTPLARTRTRRGMNELPSAWLSAVEGLAKVHSRLKRVVIENTDALELIQREDTPHTLFYCDPPYLQSTRTAPDVYGDFEMNENHHAELLDILGSIKGKFLLSGYNSELYEKFAGLHRWNRVDFNMANHAAGGTNKRRMTECVWMNY